MRTAWGLVLALSLGAAAGCGSKSYDGPTVDAFNGALKHDGKSVTFPADETVQLKLFHEKGESFGVPIQTDGSFKIGWMPTGKYSATLVRKRGTSGKTGPAPESTYTVPGGLTIANGQTEYTIELGKNWKP